jgi:hypothetical protein
LTNSCQKCADEITIGLAGDLYRFHGLDEVQADALNRRYKGYLAESPQSDDLVVEVCELAQPIPADPEAFSVDGEYALILERTSSQLTVTGINFQATLEWSEPMQAMLAVAPGTEIDRLNAAENFLRVASAYRILAKGGILLHSAGFVLEERAYLFVGQSGAGKTTLTRKAHEAGVGILSDDINVALPTEEGGFRAYPVPFAGDFGQTPDLFAPGGYPLAGLLFLEKGGNAKLETLSKSAAAARLISASAFVNADTHMTSKLIEVAANLVRRVPVRRLTSRREDDFGLIRGLLREMTDDQ